MTRSLSSQESGDSEMLDLESLDFDRGGGFVTVVAQDHRSGAVLMVARADREAMQHTISTGEMHYHSRTRGLWHKGSTSGNVQRVVSITADCDGDTVLCRVIPAGPACHTGALSCFGEAGAAGDALGSLVRVVAERKAAADAAPGIEDPNSYTRRLLADRNLRLKKIAEEAGELAVACADGDVRSAVNETADLVYHAIVALAALGAGWDDVRAVLAARHADS